MGQKTNNLQTFNVNKDNIKELKGKPIMIRFNLNNVYLYSFVIK